MLTHIAVSEDADDVDYTGTNQHAADCVKHYTNHRQ